MYCILFCHILLISILKRFLHDKYNEDYIVQNHLDKNYINKDVVINILSIGDYQYKKYLSELNLDYDEYQNKAILICCYCIKCYVPHASHSN